MKNQDNVNAINLQGSCASSEFRCSFEGAKRVTAFIMAVLMVVGVMMMTFTSVMASDIDYVGAVTSSRKALASASGNIKGAYTYGDLTYNIVFGKAVIMYSPVSGDVVIPAEIDGFPVVEIAEAAFKACTSIKSVSVGENVGVIGNEAFSGCSDLAKVTIPKSVVSIGKKAFYNTALYKNTKNWTNGVLYINNHLIEAEKGLSGSYSIKAGTLTVADYAFGGNTALTTLTIPDSLVNISVLTLKDCKALTTVKVGSKNEYYKVSDSVLYNKDMTALILYMAGDSRTTFTVPSTVKTIGDYAFRECKSLTGVTIPNSVTYIGDYAFNRCTSLESVTVPKSVTYIGDFAFNYCTSLKNITIPASVAKLGSSVLSAKDKHPGLIVECYKDSAAHEYAVKAGFQTEVLLCDHSYSGYVSDNNATCTEDGTKTARCKTCGLGKTVTEDGTKIGHKYDDILDRYCNNCYYKRAKHSGTTLAKIDGVWKYIVNGEFVKATTLVKYNGVWYYVKNGVKNNDNTLVKYNGKYYHVNGGKWVKDTTLVKYNGVWYYVKDGVKNNANTLVKYGNKWYHVNGGKKVNDTTIVKYGTKWYYVKDGVKTSATTLVKYSGKWYYVKNGVKSTDTTLVKYGGKWYYVKKGVKSTDTTLVKYGTKWYYVKDGVKTSATTIVKYNGKWYYVKSGVKTVATTLVKYGTKWYYVKNGVVDFNYSGMVKYNGKFYNVKKGIRV